MSMGLSDAQLQTIVDYLATIATPTPTTPPATTGGQAQFTTSCGSCHTAASLTGTTLTAIKGANMSMGLSDAQLQTIVDYLATL